LTLEDKNEWQDVRILIVDEVSFMSDKNLLTLDRKLKDIGNRNKPFGGFSIIFAGDFRQLELLEQRSLISYSQVHQATTGLIASMQLLY
jgi:hypothetical protein